jgi:hypothetical protein
MSTSPIARRLTLAAFVAAAVATAPAAWADTEGSALSRADVAAETVAAVQAGEMMPAGERSAPEHYTSVKTREQRKAETLLARSRDELLYGAIGSYRGNTWLQTVVGKSGKTRAERKAETMDAIARKQLPRAGEAA